MRAIAGSILVLAALVCFWAITEFRPFGTTEGNYWFSFVCSVPLALGLYFLSVKDKPGA